MAYLFFGLSKGGSEKQGNQLQPRTTQGSL